MTVIALSSLELCQLFNVLSHSSFVRVSHQLCSTSLRGGGGSFSDHGVLGDLEVGLEVHLLEVVEMLLVLHRLLLIGFNDTFHHSLASLQVSDRLDVVVGVLKVFGVSEDPVETGDFESGALVLVLELVDLLLEGEEFEINLGSFTEVDGPLDEAAEDGDVGLAWNLTANAEFISQLVQIGFSFQNEWKVA